MGGEKFRARQYPWGTVLGMKLAFFGLSVFFVVGGRILKSVFCFVLVQGFFCVHSKEFLFVSYVERLDEVRLVKVKT